MLVNHLRSNGALVAVVAPYNHTKVNTFEAINNIETSSMRCQEVRLTGYPLPFNPELSIVYPVRLSQLYDRTFGGPPDLIYLGSPASLGFQVMLQMRQHPVEAQIPIICNFQTDLAGYCEILFPQPLGLVSSWTFAKVQGYLFRHESVKTIFYPSTFVRKYLEQEAEVQSHKFDVLRRGVDARAFNPLKRSHELRKAWAPNGELILFTCARLAGEKGFSFLARAAVELDLRGLSFKLVIVGGNRNAVVEQEVKESFRPLSRKGKVIFTGFKVGEDLATHYASADVFLHCSVTETFGLVVLESMASNVPVIARDEGGPSDIVEHGVSGYLVPPDDLQGFVGQVVQVANDVQLRERLGKAARTQACDATWERISNKVAWKLANTIELQEMDEANSQITATQATKTVWPAWIWLLMITDLRRGITSRIADVKLVWGLTIIIGFWAGISVYLMFIKLALLIRDGISKTRKQ